ncbi:MAG: amino-acid N-acetyltransferase [Neisseria sp.]|nr:amino-acid N-acetyltransferase [Neisseria sp.]
MTSSNFVADFREAAPYIDYLRGKTLVVGIAGSLLRGDTLRSIAADIKLLASLGVRLVLVHGSSWQLDRLSEAAGLPARFHKGRRISDEAVLGLAKQACGVLRVELETALSSGLAGSLQRGSRLRLASGNFVSARPYGIIDGIDMGYTGSVRKVDAEALKALLDSGAAVLISPMAASLSGRTFHLSMADTAEAVAVAAGAEKLIFLIEEQGVLDSEGRLKSNLSAREVQEILRDEPLENEQLRLLRAALNAVEKGVPRCQIVSGRQDGALISELFTRNGNGTSVSQSPFMRIRAADTADIPDILTLTRPLEEAGILLKRSREYLENHIGGFFVLEHDRRIYGCVALKDLGRSAAELACLVVSPETRDGGYGEILLEHIVAESRKLGMHELFALSTHTGDWFTERGFAAAPPEALPPERLAEYSANGRASKIFRLDLAARVG